MRIVYHTAPNIEAAAEEVLVDEQAPGLRDTPVLRYLVNKDYQDDLRVLSLHFQPQEYAMALPRGAICTTKRCCACAASAGGRISRLVLLVS